MRHISAVACFFALSLLLAGCGARIEPTPAPKPSVSARSLPAVSAAADTPMPTPTRPPLPPTVVSISPDRGQEQVLAAPVTLTFDQPMDAASTSAAFSIEPNVSGQVQVKDNQLIFSPTERLKRGTEYRVKVDATASSAAGLRLPQAVTFQFTTAGFLQVTNVQPADTSVGVPVDATLVVAFNRPVVPLLNGLASSEGGAGGGPAALAINPLVITPTLAGAGEWVTTSIYRLTPAPGLAASTDYTVTVKAGLEDTMGGQLAEPYTFTFRTADPTVIDWQFARATSREGTDNVKIESPITVTFSMAMERSSTEAAFKLTEVQTSTSLSAVPGVFSWSADSAALSFKPVRALKLGAHYFASVGKSAKAASSGQGALREATGQEFTTVFPPVILKTTPREGEPRAAAASGVSFEFASPILPTSLVSGTVTILPRPTRVFTSYSDWDNVFYVNFDSLPDTAYTITLSSKVADSYGNLLGRDFALHFSTRAYDPFVQLYSRGQIGTYNAYTSTLAAVTYRNVPQLIFTLWRMTDQEFIPLAGQGYGQQWDSYRPSEPNKLREWRVKADAPHNAIGAMITELEAEAGTPLPPGLYYLTVDDGTSQGAGTGNLPQEQRQLVARTSLNLTLKTWDAGALAWATDLKTGQPAAGVDVTFTDGAALDRRATTDRDGIARVTFDRPRQPWEALLALARGGDGGFGVAASSWTQGISPWDFGLSSAGAMPRYNGYVYTDRPIYRPGQTVYWKAIIRRDDDAIYSLPAPGQLVTVTINDGEGKTLLSQQVALDGMGSVNGKLALDLEASLGYYYLSVMIPDAIGGPAGNRTETSLGVSFQVAEYRKPEYEVSAQTDRPEYIQGEQIRATVQANYFFGQPVKGARVRWVLLTSDYSFGLPPGIEPSKGGPYSFADWDWYAASRPGSGGGPLSEGEGITDTDGRYVFSVPADITKFAQSQRLTFDITILDASPQGSLGSGQAVSTQASAVVHKGEFYIGLRPQSYVSTAGKPAAADVLTVDPQGRPSSRVDVALVANRIRWYSVREQAEDGQYYWTSKAEMTAVYSETLTTASDGTATFGWTPQEPGEYKIVATARDRSGHAVRSATYTWVSGADYVPWRQENNDRIELVPDRKEYTVGDTALLLAASPYQTAVKALLTVERSGVLQYQVIDVQRNSEVITLPIRADYAPDVYASLVLVKGMDATSPAPTFRVGLTQLKVSPADKALKVILTPRCSRDVREACNVSANGTPVAAPREAITWTVQTLDAAGKPVASEVSLALVDKAVLTLAGDAAGTLMNRFYRERELGVITAATLVVNVDRLVAQLAQGAKGGGGGGGGGGELTVRREFPETAYWNAAVSTGPDGQAEVTLTLPDSLTTWIMDARAVTADTRVGQSTAELIATQDLLVRPVLPRFFVEGDKAEIAAIVHNNTVSAAEVEVALDASGLQTTTELQRKATIQAGDTAKITWPVTVQPGAADVKVTMRAAGGGLQDAIETTLPVVRYTTPEVVGTSGQVSSDDSRLELFRLPPDADTTRGGLEIRLEPSLAAGMLGSLTYLEHYPYECTEQTVSRFLPNVVSALAFKKLSVSRPELETPLAQQVGVGLQRLYAGQHLDGGWGWWPNDDSNATISSYVVLGLAKARQAGFTVDASALNQGVR